MWRCTPSFSRRTSRFCSTSPARRARYWPPWRCSMHELSQPGGWLPLVFMALMGFSMLVYVVLDGYDLGVGILLGFAADGEKDAMVESIGPFWDANETWLVLGVSLAAGYTLLGACWLLMKTEGELQRRAVAWARGSLWLAAAGIAAISVATPLVSSLVFHKWFSFPNIVLLAPVPLMTAVLFAM